MLPLIIALLLAAELPALDAASLAKRLKTLPGYEVSLFSDQAEDARALALGSDGTVYCGSKNGKVYAFKDGKAHTLLSGLNNPIGVAAKGADLYASSTDRILVLKGVQGRLADPPKPATYLGGLPKEGWHGGKVIRFGPDGKLYVSVGVPCNVCLKKAPYGMISRVEGGKLKPVAVGIRNSVGFDWNPADGRLWFTDNGRDMMGDEIPPCEVNRVEREGQHFGFPYRHGRDVEDPEFGARLPAGLDWQAPAWNLPAHNAPLGMRFHKGAILVALHGSWNRSKKDGYKVVRLKLKDGKVAGQEDFLWGFLDGEETLGRPVDIQELKDGSLLVSDDHAGAIYRISPRGAAR